MKTEKKTLGIIADTHENMPAISRAVEIFNERDVNCVLHAGDFISPLTANPLSKLKSELIGVFGNNDGDRLFLRKSFEEENIGRINRDPHRFEISGTQILLMHQPKFLDILQESGWGGVVVYGHTHRVDVREGKPLILNPGECGGWLTGRSSIGILDLEEREVEIIDLDIKT